MNGYLGIDVSKGYADFVLLDEKAEQFEEVFQLDDTRKGHDLLIKLLDEFIKKYGLNQIYCGVESTGGFENNWYNSLIQWSKKLPLLVVRINPFLVKSNTGATLQRNVTDALSSRYIAEYLIAQHSFINYSVQSAHYSSFRSFSNHINLEKRQCSQLISELKAILYSTFPELLRFCKDSVPVWVLEIIKKYPSVSQISKLKPDKLANIKHVDTKKAESIINKAKASVASRNNVTDAFLIMRIANEIQQKQLSIKEQKKFLAEQCKGPEIDLLTSIPGIAEYSAAVIMVEIENIERFQSPKHLVSYFGLHPEIKDSGDKKGQYRLSKRGRASIRGALYMCAQSAVIFDSHLKAIYHKHRNQGMNHRKAMGVIMHKLLRIVWGVLKGKKAYDSVIDQQNQIKDQNPPADISRLELKAKRRFQHLDVDAPISAIHTKKRKVYSESQVECIEQVRDLRNTPM